MGALVFVLLFFLGILIATVGGIIGVVDAFRVSTLWGFLALFIPFALLVFCIKFWRERKWARNSLILSLIGTGVSLLAIPLMGGLAMLSARNSLENDLEDFTVETVPGDPNAEPGTPEDGALEVPTEQEPELFQESMLPGLPTAAEIARAELLPSTDPNERIKEINRERSDPYAIVTVPPAVPPRPPASANPPSAPANTSPPPTAIPPTPTTGAGAGSNNAPGGSSPGVTTPGGGSQPTRPLPELPEPTVVASQVQVSGVAAVNGETYVIVKAPGEPTSRYVKVGDRISNGTVLVKRIENRLGTSPVVVFEERGEEIALPVGANVSAPEEETAGVQSPSTTPVALLPIPKLN